jgi:hypothetical protein
MRNLKRLIIAAAPALLLMACQAEETANTTAVHVPEAVQETPNTATEPGTSPPAAAADKPAEQPAQDDPAPDPATDPAESAAQTAKADQPKTPVTGQIGTGTTVSLAPIVEPPNRIRRRMDIDQLNLAIQRVTGGIAWELKNKNQFDVLASTLGKPDYVDQTKEDLLPSALFQKFLDDAARSVCTTLADKEPGIAASERVLMVYVKPNDTWVSNSKGVDDNLKMLVLRYHGRDLESKPAELEQWRWLFKSAMHVSKDPVASWRTICVGLMTHPYFYTY